MWAACKGLVCVRARAQAKDKKKAGVFEAPVYRIKKRTGLNYVTAFALRTDEPPAKWVLRGVALLCSID
jgi:dynein heavy chain